MLQKNVSLNSQFYFKTYASHLNVVSSLWLEYPLELLTCRFIIAVAFADFRVGYDGLCFLETFEGEFSDEDDVSSTVSEEKKNNKIFDEQLLPYLPL